MMFVGLQPPLAVSLTVNISKYMSGAKNYFLLALDMAKVGVPKRLNGCEGFNTNLNIPSPLPTTLVLS